ncbi:unnamed protein product [Urochloa humidicola]
MKYLRIANGIRVVKLPEDIEKLQHLKTLEVRGTGISKLPASIIQLQRLVRLLVNSSVQLPDGIGNLQELEELSLIDLGIQSVKFIQGLGELTNLKVLEIDWRHPTEVHDVEGHTKACISSLSKLFINLQELRVDKDNISDATLSFMVSYAPTIPPLRRLILICGGMPHQLSSLVNLTRLYIKLGGDVSKQGINILACLPILASLTAFLSDDKAGDSGILHPRHAINSQGFQRLVKFNFFCWKFETALEFEPGAMPKLERLKLVLPARCQFKYGQGGLVLGLQNLKGLKRIGLAINCGAATADEAQALEDDIRGAAGPHPNRPVLQVNRFYHEFMAQGCSRRPSDHPILEAP